GITRLLLHNRVLLTADSGEALAEYGMVSVTSASVAGAAKAFITVPEDERWSVEVIRISRVAGDRTAVYILAYDSSLADDIVVEEFTAAAEYTWSPPNLHLEPNDQLGVYFTGGATDGNWIVECWRRREYVR
ncbi:MAG: hypothetical protein ACYTAO_16455, partial [Planctomycetota bacterium]